MATGTQGEFVAVVNDTDPKSNGKAYSLKISGNNYSQILNLVLSRMDTLNSLKSYLFSMSIKKYTMSLDKRTSTTIYNYPLFCGVKHNN